MSNGSPGSSQAINGENDMEFRQLVHPDRVVRWTSCPSFNSKSQNNAHNVKRTMEIRGRVSASHQWRK